MRVLAVCAFFAAFVWWIVPAVAQQTTSEALPKEAAIGRIVITNRPTTADVEELTVRIGGAEVHIHYRATPNHLPDPRDIITITVSEGYIAIPSDILLPEGETVEVLIYEAILG